jgi:hypothetical protein
MRAKDENGHFVWVPAVREFGVLKRAEESTLGKPRAGI